VTERSVAPPAPDGVVVVDKPAGWTSHDVVARMRLLAGTRRVGHAGTLDPMATGVLVVGIGKATKLLGHLGAHDKDYLATIRIGITTTTDDAEGAVVSVSAATGVTNDRIEAVVATLTGEIEQVPAAVSAIKVAGVRSYTRVRAGEAVQLAPRPVTVSRFEVLARRGDELDVAVTCSAGTYVRAVARDLGAALGVGGHLTVLRRTRVGGFSISDASTLDALAADLRVVPLAAAVEATFPRIDVSVDDARRIGFGQPVGFELSADGPVGVFGPDGDVLALMQRRDGVARSLVVFAPAP
jgi:tRNA pseudouridine55 synthase